MNETQLIELVKQIRDSSGCKIDLDGLLGKFEAHVNAPECSQFIFLADGGRLLSAEEVVAKAGVRKQT